MPLEELRTTISSQDGGSGTRGSVLGTNSSNVRPVEPATRLCTLLHVRALNGFGSRPVTRVSAAYRRSSGEGSYSSARTRRARRAFICGHAPFPARQPARERGFPAFQAGRPYACPL
jgi:hypothetical protein